MHVDKNSYGTLALVYIGCAAVIFILFKFIHIWWVALLLALVFVWFAGWQTAFHLVPNRERIGSDTLVTSVSDGKIVIIDKVFEDEYFKSECMQVSIYMDFWDVHANFWPITGEVTYTKYHPGKHLLAFKPKASLENEHHCTCIRNANGREVFFKQLAGGFARRIVCYAKEGMNVESGRQCGIIKFGSRVDFFLPLDADIQVSLGQEVRACETVIAKI